MISIFIDGNATSAIHLSQTDFPSNVYELIGVLISVLFVNE